MTETNCASLSARILLCLRIITEEIIFMDNGIIERLLNGKSGFLGYGWTLLSTDYMTLIKLLHLFGPWLFI